MMKSDEPKTVRAGVDPVTRRRFVAGLAAAVLAMVWPRRRAVAQSNGGANGGPGRNGGQRGNRRRGGQDYVLPAGLSAFADLSLVLGRVTDRAVTVSMLSAEPIEIHLEFGTALGHYDRTSKPTTLVPGIPTEVVLDGLRPDTPYVYRARYRKPGEPAFASRAECRFHTQRRPGSTFTFAIQGDSHPERPQMSDPALYARTLLVVAAAAPDFYICMGDDFSVAPVREVTADSVAARYTLQRPFLGLVAQSAPLFLLNGNHEQASLFNYQQTDVRHDVAVHAQNARNRFYPTPGPGDFYSGDAHPLKSIGLLKDYYSWTWGDALFVVLDNYWQAPVLVDTGFQEGGGGGGGGGGADRGGRAGRDWWGLTLGEAQYRWFKRTLEQSTAKHKFVFAHHVLGSGRGGVDQADLFEWGGQNKRGDWEFAQRRPGWEMPVHQLMVKHGVTVFFQGHDHLFARQELDGVVYQEVPMPADAGYVAYNADRYRSGTKLPNSGHLRVTVSPEAVKVEYVRTYLPQDEGNGRTTGEIADSHTIETKRAHV